MKHTLHMICEVPRWKFDPETEFLWESCDVPHNIPQCCDTQIIKHQHLFYGGKLKRVLDTLFPDNGAGAVYLAGNEHVVFMNLGTQVTEAQPLFTDVHESGNPQNIKYTHTLSRTGVRFHIDSATRFMDTLPSQYTHRIFEDLDPNTTRAVREFRKSWAEKILRWVDEQGEVLTFLQQKTVDAPTEKALEPRIPKRPGAQPLKVGDCKGEAVDVRGLMGMVRDGILASVMLNVKDQDEADNGRDHSRV